MKMERIAVILFSVCAVAIAQRSQSSTRPASVQAVIDDTYTRKLADGNTVVNKVSGQFHRDAQGRTRWERGNIVTIQDPGTRTLVVLDLKAKVARRYTSAQTAEARMLPSMSEVTGHRQGTDLGTQVIEGFQVTGRQYSVVVPPGAVGNILPIKQISEVWRSDQLAMPLLIKSSDVFNGDYVQSYRVITINGSLDPALFTIPGDFQVMDLVGETPSGSKKAH